MGCICSSHGSGFIAKNRETGRKQMEHWLVQKGVTRHRARRCKGPHRKHYQKWNRHDTFRGRMHTPLMIGAYTDTCTRDLYFTDGQGHQISQEGTATHLMRKPSSYTRLQARPHHRAHHRGGSHTPERGLHNARSRVADRKETHKK